MMCVIIDTNLASLVFTPSPATDLRPVFDWLHAEDQNGGLVFGGKLFKELSHRKASRRYVRALVQAGRAYQIPDTAVQAAEIQVSHSDLCQSDDPHVVALARVSGARTLCSHDQALHQDFRNPQLLSKPRGHVYQNATHTHVLCHTSSCPRGYGKRR